MYKLGQVREIPFSRTKLILASFGSLIFVGFGFLFVIKPEKFVSPFMRTPELIFIGGLASIIFFGLCLFFLAKKLGDNSPGLVISEEGIFDNSSGVSAGQIKWTDIEDISVIEINRQKLIILQVKNPQDYIDKQTSGFKRKIMTMNYKMFGTPLSLTSNGLKISFSDLLSLLTDKLKEARD